MTAYTATAAVLAPLRGYARTENSTGSPALKPGVFTVGVDDIRIYGEVRGRGPLIILQNGMWLASFTDFFGKAFMEALAKHFTVLTFDPRGQGRTSAGRGPITYGRFAADTVRLMDILDIDRAHFIGHSDGGGIQLHLLLDFADRVKTSTLVGTAYSHEAYSEQTKAVFTEWFDQMRQGKDSAWPGDDPSQDTTAAARLREQQKRYEAMSPNPEKFHAMRLKKRNCWAVEPNFSVRQLATIDRPVLVIAAGKDEHIPAEQFKVLADSIPGSERVYFSDMTHDIGPFMDEISEAAIRFARKHQS
jgi:aminoacrylate hydrolase